MRARAVFLEREQEAFLRQAPAVAAKGARSAGHSVAGHDQEERVSSDGRADGSAGTRGTYSARNFAVGRGLSVGDGKQLMPDA